MARGITAGVVVGLAFATLVALPPGALGASGAVVSAVTTCAGSGPGSLPDLITHASAGTTVTLSHLCPGRSPVLLTHTIDIDRNLTISGPGPGAAVVTGNGRVSDFAVAPGVLATFSGFTIENGRATPSTDDTGGPDSTDMGGGIFNQGTVTLTDMTLSGSMATIGGAIDNQGTLTVTDSTIVDNSAVSGGGLYNDGPATVTNTTFAHNSATGGSAADGGGIDSAAVPFKIGATIIASSSPPGSDCAGVAALAGDLGANIDDDGSCGFHAATDHSDVPPGLDPSGLRQNGGLTETIALVPGSPAIAAVSNSSLCSSLDQRGVTRPTPCDSGAVQLTLPLEQITSAATAGATVGSSFSFTVTTSGSPVPRITRIGPLPKHVKFVDNGDGTATMSGTPVLAGSYLLVIKATFGQGRAKNVVTEDFALTVDPAD